MPQVFFKNLQQIMIKSLVLQEIATKDVSHVIDNTKSHSVLGKENISPKL